MYLVLGVLSGVALSFYLAYKYYEKEQYRNSKAYKTRKNSRQQYRKQMHELNQYKMQLSEFVEKDFKVLLDTTMVLKDELKQAVDNLDNNNNNNNNNPDDAEKENENSIEKKKKKIDLLKDRIKREYLSRSEGLLRLMERIDGVHPLNIWLEGGFEDDPMSEFIEDDGSSCSQSQVSSNSGISHISSSVSSKSGGPNYYSDNTTTTTTNNNQKMNNNTKDYDVEFVEQLRKFTNDVRKIRRSLIKSTQKQLNLVDKSMRESLKDINH
ncbi:hypothetical protein H4219_005813 [Mycoemilia scoparia]|uniref:Uncharacterized protein n=1 Tax=Mycoemilia scoparia TaxID=417184 RepID=A0A9W8DNP2_9FUNG|nr:hypothetical protein H4219_005813 [Mycoemilia scoparia]